MSDGPISRSKLFGLRIVLPAIQTAAYWYLIAVGWREHTELARAWAGWIDAPYSAPVVSAMAINLPVMIAAIPVGLFAALAGASNGLIAAVLVGCMVGPFWYWIGKRLDQAFGILPPRPGAFRCPDLLLLTGCCVLVLGTATLYWYMRWTYLIEMKLGLLFWSIAGMWAVCRAAGRRDLIRSSSPDSSAGLGPPPGNAGRLGE